MPGKTIRRHCKRCKCDKCCRARHCKCATCCNSYHKHDRCCKCYKNIHIEEDKIEILI
jgi:hypothetical protein